MGGYGGSIASNPRVALVDLTQNGSDWLWAAFAVMFASALGMVFWAHSVPTGRRAFHFAASVVLFTASIAYFCMASDLGGTPIDVEFVRNTGVTYTGNMTPVTRSIWYVRYIDWVITTPMLLLTLLLGTGMPLSGIFFTVFMDLVMIITGLVGALVASQYKWGFFVFGCIAMFYVFWSLIGPARKHAALLSPQHATAYTTSTFVLAGLWLIYPIIWGIADGGNVISTDSEMVAYGVLDLLAKPVFTYFHLFQLSKVPYESFRLQSGHASAFAANGGFVGDSFTAGSTLEKHNGYANGHANGHTNLTPTPTATTAAPAPAENIPLTQQGHPSVAEHHATVGSQHVTSGAGVVQESRV